MGSEASAVMQARRALDARARRTRRTHSGSGASLMLAVAMGATGISYAAMRRHMRLQARQAPPAFEFAPPTVMAAAYPARPAPPVMEEAPRLEAVSPLPEPVASPELVPLEERRPQARRRARREKPKLRLVASIYPINGSGFVDGDEELRDAPSTRSAPGRLARLCSALARIRDSVFPR